MEENKVVDMPLEDELGQVQIADDVIAVIAEIAALEVEGMVAIGQGKPDLVQTIRGKKASKSIKVEVDEDNVTIDVFAVIKYGVKIQEVCLKVQEKVKNSIETMTGLNVPIINVHVIGVQFGKTHGIQEL